MAVFTTKKRNYNILLGGNLGLVSFNVGKYETKDSRIIAALRKFPTYGTAFIETDTIQPTQQK